MSFEPLSVDTIVGRGTRLHADYVLRLPPDAFLPPERFDRSQQQQWTAIFDARPGLEVEGVKALTGQVVRVSVIVTKSDQVGSLLGTWAVVRGPNTPGGPAFALNIDRQYSRGNVQRAGSASFNDIQLAEQRTAEVLRDPPIVEFAQSVSSGVATTAKLTPAALLLGAAVAGFLFVRSVT